jgi:hypothetical protein
MKLILKYRMITLSNRLKCDSLLKSIIQTFPLKQSLLFVLYGDDMLTLRSRDLYALTSLKINGLLSLQFAQHSFPCNLFFLLPNQTILRYLPPIGKGWRKDAEVAKHYLSDRVSFEATARYWAETFAGAPSKKGSAQTSIAPTPKVGMSPDPPIVLLSILYFVPSILLFSGSYVDCRFGFDVWTFAWHCE